MATQKFLDQNGLSTLWTKIKGLTAPYALTAARATYAASAGYAQSALTASRATTAGYSTTASNATYAASAGYATTASRATYAASAGYVAKAADSDKLDGLDSTAFATAGHTHTLPHTSVEWSNISTIGLGPIDMGISSVHNANRLAYAKPAGITIEYSTNNGSTWVDYGATNLQKIDLVSGIGSYFVIGKKSSGVTVNDKLRVTLHSSNMNVYTAAKRLLLNISTNGAGGTNVKLEYSNNGSETTFKTAGTYSISGWSGWNAIPINVAFGGSDSQTSQWRTIRLTFGITSVHASYSSILTLSDIALHGDTYWTIPSNMAKNGHLYTWDSNMHATFPADVYATNFRGTLVGTASQATTAGYATTAARATYAASAGYAGSAGSATTAGYATTAARATYAASAGYAGSATTASNATYAASAGSSTTAGHATTAARATYAASAGFAQSSTTASYAVNADKLDGLQATAFATAGHTHSYATQSDINTAISNLINGATSTLDTLNELAKAIGNDPNYSTTILTALNGKLDKSATATIVVGKSITATEATHAASAGYAANANQLDGLDSTDFSRSTHTHRSFSTTNYDTRSVATTPNLYANLLSFEGLKNNTSINSPSTDTYSYVLGLRGWSDSSGGESHELAFNNTGIFRRTGASTTWGTWAKCLDSGNSSVTGGGSSWGSSITVNLGGTSKTLTIPSNPNTDSKVYNTTTTSTYYLCGSTSNSASTGTLVKRTDVYVNGSGALYAVKFHESSDETLKDFKEDIDVNLDELAKLPKKYFTWKKDENGELCIGTSAQELQKLYPELVDTNIDGTLTVDYNKLSIIALAAIDKLNDKNKELEERLEKVEKILSKLNIE